MSKAIFITGTGTDIGKTYVTGLIVKKLAESGASAAYYKAAMSGNDRRPALHGNRDTGACGAYSGKAEATDRGRICRACVSAC